MGNTMNFKEFWTAHVAIMSDNVLAYEDNVDLWSMMTGYIYYKDNVNIGSVTGIQYNRDGDALEGDFEGYLKNLQELVAKHNEK